MTKHKDKSKLILLFGSFDGLHPGHEHLIKSALKIGFLTISLATDHTITKLKNKPPLYSFVQRKKNLLEKFPEINVVKGDEKQGAWSSIKKLQPSAIIIGYDQGSLKKSLLEIQTLYDFEIIQIDSFFPEKYKSSILRKQ